MANRAAGKGYENTEFYENVEFQFLGIENIHVMRQSLQKLVYGTFYFFISRIYVLAVFSIFLYWFFPFFVSWSAYLNFLKLFILLNYLMVVMLLYVKGWVSGWYIARLCFYLLTVYFKKQRRVSEKITLWILNHVCLLTIKG